MPHKSYKRRLEYQRDYDKKNRSSLRAAARQRYAENIVARRRWRRQYEKQRREKVKAELHALLGGKCVRCGFTDSRALQVDHVAGHGLRELRRSKSNRSHFRRVTVQVKRGSKKYQLLCANCNWIKRHENNEVHNGRFHP